MDREDDSSNKRIRRISAWEAENNIDLLELINSGSAGVFRNKLEEFKAEYMKDD